MRLDLYVGSLTRYHAGAWEPGVRRIAAAPGELDPAIPPVRHVPDGVGDPVEIEEVIRGWMELTGELLEPELPAGTTFDWPEGCRRPYAVDRPGSDGYGALLLWAAHTEHPELACPAEAGGDPVGDPAFRASTAPGFPSRYDQLLGPDLWLPVAFSGTWSGPYVTGQRRTLGSSPRLLEQLEALRHGTWAATAAAGETQVETPLERGARAAFGIVLELCQQAVEHRLPMLLHR
jgi:hypothetical protein